MAVHLCPSVRHLKSMEVVGHKQLPDQRLSLSADLMGIQLFNQVKGQMKSSSVKYFAMG